MSDHDTSSFIEKLQEIKGLQSEIANIQSSIVRQKTQIFGLQEQIETYKRAGSLTDLPNINEDYQITHGILSSSLNSLSEKTISLKNKIAELELLKRPSETIKSFKHTTPFFLFPIRIETKYKFLNSNHPELWIRVFPDDIAIDSHEPEFTKEEVDKVKFYFSEVEKTLPFEQAAFARLVESLVEEEEATKIKLIGEHYFLEQESIHEAVRYYDISDDSMPVGIEYWEELERLREKYIMPAWIDLVEEFGPHRSAYLIKQGKDFFYQEDIPLRPDSWSKAAHTTTMPDYFVFRLYTINITTDEPHEELYKEVYGRFIPDPLTVGPDPLQGFGEEAFDEVTSENGGQPDHDNAVEPDLFFDDNSKWMIDFQKAVVNGMGIKVALSDLSRSTIEQGFSTIIVLGVKTLENQNTDSASNVFRELFENNRYTNGISLPKQGTPTNNIEGIEAGYNSQENNFTQSYTTEILKEQFPDWRNDLNLTDGYRLSQILGIDHKEVLNHIEGAGETDYQDALHMARTLWPVTWGAYLSIDLLDKLVYQIDIDEFKSHYLEFVRARAPFSMLRIDDMPYGILPVSNYDQWEFRADEEKKGFYNKLFAITRNLARHWLKLSENPETVPRIGATDDPDKELVDILGMQASATNIHNRSIMTDNYIRDTLKFSWPSLFTWERIFSFIRNLFPGTNSNTGDENTPTPGYSYDDFTKEYEKSINASIQFFNSIVGMALSLPLIHTATWGDGYRINKSLIQQETLSENKTLVNNYIKTLIETNIVNNIRDNIYTSTDNGGEDPPDTILFNQLRNAILTYCSKNDISTLDDNDDLKNDLVYLSKLPSAKLERLLTEVLDLSTHRIDAWLTSFVLRRLKFLKDSELYSKPYVGAYGFIEELKPADNRESGGYILSPSITHGVTAAVLRNAYLTHANSENADVMRVNLSSERVQKALWYMEGIRNGQSLSVLLGYRFERALHEKHLDGSTELNIDQYIVPFRKLYPLNAGKETEVAAGKPVEKAIARNVVDGLDLLKAYKTYLNNDEGGLPFSTDEGLRSMSSREKKAILQELDDLDETFDAISDFVLAESVHQTMLGKYEAAGAALNATSADGSPPDRFLISKTPRGGVDIKHVCMILFPKDLSDLPQEWRDYKDLWADTVKSTVSPILNVWAAGILGNPENILCKAEYFLNNNPVNLTISACGFKKDTEPEFHKVFNISALDFVYLSANRLKGESTELEQIMIYHIKKQYSLDEDCKIQFSYERDSTFTSDQKSFAEALPVAKTILHTITQTPYLKPQDLFLPQETEEGNHQSDDNSDISFQGFTINEYNRLKSDLYGLAGNPGLFNDLKSAKKSLTNPAGNVNIDHIITNMENMIPFSIPGSIPSIDEKNRILRVKFDEATRKMIIVVSGSYSEEDIENVQIRVAGPGFNDEEISSSGENLWEIEKAIPVDITVTDASQYRFYISCPDTGTIVQTCKVNSIQLIGSSLNAVVMEIEKRLKECDNKYCTAEAAIESIQIIKTELNEETRKLAMSALGIYDKENNSQVVIRVTGPGVENQLVEQVAENQWETNIDIPGTVTIPDNAQYSFNITITDGSIINKNCIVNTEQAVNPDTKTDKINFGIEQLIGCYKALLGKSTVILPQFQLSNSAELNQTFSHSLDLLQEDNINAPKIWFQQAARTHPQLSKYETLSMLSKVHNNFSLNMHIGQLPYRTCDRWIALPWANDSNRETNDRYQGNMSLTVFYPESIGFSKTYVGLMLDRWDEIIPNKEETASIAYQYNRPSCEAPNVCLFCVSPVISDQNDPWNWNHLVGCIEQTMKLMRIRAVDLDALEELGRFLPALYMKGTAGPINAILSFPFNITGG